MSSLNWEELPSQCPAMDDENAHVPISVDLAKGPLLLMDERARFKGQRITLYKDFISEK